MKLIRNHAVSDMACPEPTPSPSQEGNSIAGGSCRAPLLGGDGGELADREGRGEGGRYHSTVALRPSVLIALSLLAAGILSLAVAAPDASAPAKSAVTQITSQAVDFDLKARQATYRGDVTVLDPRIRLTCETLTATIAESGGRVDSLVAESNVVAIIATNDTVFTVTSSKAIYSYQVTPKTTNQTLELSGLPEPKITWPQTNGVVAETNVFTARRILWNISAGTIKAEGHRGVFPNVDALKNVAAPAAATNKVVAPNPANP
jgi:lipopolysaccharide export system protein LptA